MSRPRPARTRIGTTLAGVALAGTLLGACGSAGGGGLAQEACAHVNRSIALYDKAAREQGAAAAATRKAALVELRRALRPAALAGSAGGQFQALQATLSESSRVPESQLVSALSAQCAAAQAVAGTS